MELGTFGAIFRAAITLEERLMKRYSAEQDSQSEPETQVLYGKLAKQGRRLLQRLERTRRETITEMILEPITGFEMAEDLVSLDAQEPFSPAEASGVELGISAFYQEAAEKIGQPEAARAMRRLAKEHTKRAEQLAG